jgi:hypothetical protein
MRRVVIAVALSAGLVLAAGQVEAQYRYTDDKGVSKTTQYKLDVPSPYRESAVWIGPTGVGKPGLSEEQRQINQRWDIYHRIGGGNPKLVPGPYKQPEPAAAPPEKDAGRPYPPR